MSLMAHVDMKPICTVSSSVMGVINLHDWGGVGIKLMAVFHRVGQ